MEASSRPTQHYLLLDGLRGVAALLVLAFHLFEAVAFAAGRSEQDMFHGFLAVDFFLILSGFVMAYAYDARWQSMSVGSFFRRRLVRLHPMVVAGVVFGVIVFVAQGAVRWDGTPMSWTTIVASLLFALFLLPSPLMLDVRGNTEMFPLNGPHWSLFFEYLFNILYALLLRRFSTRGLLIWVVGAAAALLAYALFGPEGTIGCGWSSSPTNMLGGFLRVASPSCHCGRLALCHLCNLVGSAAFSAIVGRGQCILSVFLHLSSVSAHCMVWCTRGKEFQQTANFSC